MAGPCLQLSVLALGDRGPKKKTYIRQWFQVIDDAEGSLILVEIEENSQSVYATHYLDGNVSKRSNVCTPATDNSSLSPRPKNSIANRDASGEEGLWVGGVGNDDDGADGETRASKDNE